MEATEETRALIDAMKKAFPDKDGGFTGAVFFHHDKDGKLKTMSPLFAEMNEKSFTIKIAVARLLEYSHACQTMASDMVAKTLPHS